MEAIWGFIQEYWPVLAGFLGGTILPMAMASWWPNERWHSWGVSVGKKLSEKGRGFFGSSSWEQLENSMLGSFASFVQGVEEGANLDDEL